MNKNDIINQGTRILEKLERKYHLNLDGLIQAIKSYNKDFDENNFRFALMFAAVAHDGQVRKQEGIPYIVHPFEAAKILTQIHADETTLIAALLHDVPEDTAYTLDQVEILFGKQVSYLVEGITKLSKVHYHHNMQQRQVESMKKLFIHVAEDPRTMLIKLADRLHNMRTLEYMDVPEKRIRISKETLEIFTPIASLLGIKELQTELEDLCFQNLYPEDFHKLKKIVSEARENHKKTLALMIDEVEQLLRENKIDAIVYAYKNNLYDIYKRLKRENKKIDEYEIIFSINVIVDEITTCYEALGLIHSSYRPKPGTIKDYISLPKANGYQSLHTKVFGDGGIITKFCIRTNQMHFEAQYGIAASYFDVRENKNKPFPGNNQRSQWVEEVIEIQKDFPAESLYLDELKQFILHDRITVLTPKGKAIELPANATCIDFAYLIHTELGHRALRAIVNDQRVPLDYQLKKGDVVKIISTDYPKKPSYEWLSFAKTPQACKKMRDFFKHESAVAKIQIGKKMLQKEYDRAGCGLVSAIPAWKVKIAAEKYPWLHIQKLNDLFINIAEGNIFTVELVNILSPTASLNIDSIVKQNISKLPEILKKMTKFHLRIVTEPFANLTKIVEVTQMKKDTVIMVSSVTKFSFLTKKMYIDATMFVRTYNDISNICREIEQIEGVNEVRRVFPAKKYIFFLGSIFTFAFWVVHPFLLFWITNSWQAPEQDIRNISNVVFFSGLLILFSLILFLQQYTARSFPEFREANRLWQVAYIVSFFALVTVFWEIYLYKPHFDWLWGLGAVILIFTYLTGYYIYFRERKKF